ncbi:hypothetical protein GOODEAATRI_028547 [Goodea atripinnis]|uniref:Uncharacterized protein n=1 Tax=Goodea atripinnis TaxID=208336 RepID=A0ABV0NEE1_9TELE
MLAACCLNTPKLISEDMEHLSPPPVLQHLLKTKHIHTLPCGHHDKNKQTQQRTQVSTTNIQKLRGEIYQWNQLSSVVYGRRRPWTGRQSTAGQDTNTYLKCSEESFGFHFGSKTLEDLVWEYLHHA